MKFSTAFIAAGTEYMTFLKSVPAPAFRREFELGKAKHAELTICGLGFYELYINGNRITRGLLSSYIANPDDILYYDTYNLTPYLNEGTNVIGVLLGNGMLNCPGGQVWEFDTARFRSAPKLALTFEASLEDGSTVEFDASEGFVCADSPIILDDIRIGEFYDARNELGAWTKAGYDASAWRTPIKAEIPRGECRLCDVDPILPTKELKPVSITKGGISKNFKHKHRRFPDLTDEFVLEYPADEPTEGYIYDFGVNAAGLCRLHIKDAKPGQKIILQFAENYEDGGLDLRGMDFLPKRFNHRDMYICKGGEEVWMPKFTYHGFRYVLVLGLEDAQATPDLLTYVVMNTSLRQIGEFGCSNEIANKLWDAVIVSDLANFYHFPTDCPHREKNGWTADAALSAEQMLMALTPERNYREWMHNITKAMDDNGSIPGIIPTTGWGFEWGNGPAWDLILITLPWYVWVYRGDTTIIRENAATILRYINYITTRRDAKGLIHIGLGDWCPAARGGSYQAPLEFTDTVLCYDICKKAAKMFEVIGMHAQKLFAEAVADEFRTAARKYLIDKKTLTALGRCQTTQAMAIYYDIFDDSEKQAAFMQLLTIIDNDGRLVDSGVLGMRVIFHVLSEFGRTDLAFRMITRTDYPSYGYMIKHDATALWECFHVAGENPSSLNHHFFGDINAWFLKHLVGININPYLENANEVMLAPKFINELENAHGSHIAPAGKISAEWHRDGGVILYSFEIPAGMDAEMRLEPGFKFADNGRAWRRISGKGTVRIIAESEKDDIRITARN